MSSEHVSNDQEPERVHLAQRSFPIATWSDRGITRDLVLRRRIVVGTAPTADVVLHDSSVSRFHAEMEPRDDGLWIRDLDSRAGVLVDGVRARESLIPVGRHHHVALGNTSFAIDYTRGVVGAVEQWASESFYGLVARSAVMRELFATTARIAKSETPVLLRGETGTGKDVLARAIHDASPRADRPYVIVRCAELPEAQLDAEIFGHTRGAFVGAMTARAGALEVASGGTVFFDEIGEMPMTLQVKLLRVLEQRSMRRIGESAYRPTDVRFVSASHRDLLAMVVRGDFREDLHAQLSAVSLTLPPLRDHLEDIDVLVSAFTGGRPLDPEMLAQMHTQRWRSNVRELRNAVQGVIGDQIAREPLNRNRSGQTEPPAMMLGETDPELDPLRRRPPSFAPPSERPRPKLPEPAHVDPASFATYEGTLKVFRERWIEAGERAYLQRLLQENAGNVVAVARIADVDRTYIYRLMRKYGL